MDIMSTIKFKTETLEHKQITNSPVDVIQGISIELMIAYLDGAVAIMNALEAFSKDSSRENLDEVSFRETLLNKYLLPMQSGLGEHYFDKKAVEIFTKFCLAHFSTQDFTEDFKEILKKVLEDT